MYNNSNFQQSVSASKAPRTRHANSSRDNYTNLNIEDLEQQRPQMKRQWPMLKKKTKRVMAEEAEIRRAQATRMADFYDE